jgi:protein TonB
MERPSHMSFPQLCLPCRLPMVAAALSFQVLVFWLFANGTGTRIIEIIRGPVVVKFEKSQLPKTPPPTEPKLERLQPIVAIPPEIPTNAGSNDDPRITSVRDEPVTDTVPPAAAITRAPLRNAATNTTPPYPIIARRLGWEGTVTLRLSVTEAGRVARAEVVTSSGHDELDQTAQSWVVERWTYRPAMRDGAPMPGQVLARVQFSLDDR